MNTIKDQNIERSSKIEFITNSIQSTLNSYGYLELNLPIYEYYDLLHDTVFNFSDEGIVTFVDRHTGKTLVLRPDFTPQVCRLVSCMNTVPSPFRIYYKGSVFRSVEKDKGVKSEDYQIGWELFNNSSIYGDIEIVLAANQSLKTIGLNDFIFTFGDSLFFNRLKELIKEYDNETADALFDAISNRKIFEIKNIIKKINIKKELENLIVYLPTSFGNKDSINKLKELSTFDNILKDRLTYIENFIEKLIELGLSSEQIIFDGAESKGLDYYTGINFEILHPKFGKILGSGGRYDTLMNKFNKNIPACGVALNIESILSFNLKFNNEMSYDYLVIGDDNFKAAQELRQKGNSVIFINDKTNLEYYINNYKFKNIL